jgi:tetraacyldisaccharide 4'-kinase
MKTNIFLKISLFPFYLIFVLIVWIKNKLYDNQLIKSFSPSIFTINIGNLAVGGTGKTPMVEYLTARFMANTKLAVLSRGYGRKTKGFFMANDSSDAATIGDEPFQYYLKFKNYLSVFVGENRVEAFKKLMLLKPHTKLLILDDAFQHRKIKANINIVLIDYNNLVFDDLMLPLGYLREPITSLVRAEMVVITKCPIQLNSVEAEVIKDRFQVYISLNVPVYFTSIAYENPVQFSGNKKEIGSEVLTIAGLANPATFIDYCQNNWKVVEHLSFPDHHDYSEKDLLTIIGKLGTKTDLLMAEKDFVKLRSLLPNHINAFYLPIHIKFLFNEGNEFNMTIQQKMSEFYG